MNGQQFATSLVFHVERFEGDVARQLLNVSRGTAGESPATARRLVPRETFGAPNESSTATPMFHVKHLATDPVLC